MKAYLVATGKHFDMYEVKGKTESYTVSYNKDKNKYKCDCPHGSGNFKGECWHVNEVRKMTHSHDLKVGVS